MSMRSLVSPGTRSVASDSKATNRPSALIEGHQEWPAAGIPAASALTSSVAPLCLSRTKMSQELLASSGTRSGANDMKATKRPSPLMEGLQESALPA